MKNRLAEVRREKGVSQLALAKITGVSPSDLSRIENHRMVCYPNWRKRISRALAESEARIFPLEELR